jgi:hypothetical protein
MPGVIDLIASNPKPGDTASAWKRTNKKDYGVPLDDEEQAYLDLYTSDAVPKDLRIGRGIANIGNLDADEQASAKRIFGDGPLAKRQFSNLENRRRIVAHYVYTHPVTIAYELQLYRTTRDVVPPLFLAERVYELITGKEAFTGDKTARIWAAVEIAIPIIASRLLRFVAPAVEGPRYTRALTDPIYDLPPEGGGMTVNGRWYTEHALERMAPDTPEIRATLRTRTMTRLEKIGIKPGSPAWDACLNKALSKIDPRGVPPSVVEAEIMQKGSTNVRVITARQGRIVVSVIPRKG